jgi:hypothetical protein
MWSIGTVTAREHRGHWTCAVVSTHGNHSATTILDPREPPPHITAGSFFLLGLDLGLGL